MKRRPHRAGRPSPPPPAVRLGPGETLEGSAVLDEFWEPLGALLWQTLRDVFLWAGARPDERAGLFASGALRNRTEMLWKVGAHPELKAPLTELAGLCDAPALAEPAGVAAACRRIARWAERRGSAPGTALAFAQAAALAHPADAAAALETGRLALRHGEEARAESWFRRAAALARRSGDGVAYGRAHLELGHVLARRGGALAASRAYLFALRRARRAGLRDVRREAVQGLFDLARDAKTPAEASTLAGAALRVAGAGHPRAPEAFRAWARVRLAENPSTPFPGPGEPTLPFPGSVRGRAHLLAVLAREAASVGAAGTFERALDASWKLLDASAPGAAGVRRSRALLDPLTCTPVYNALSAGACCHSRAGVYCRTVAVPDDTVSAFKLAPFLLLLVLLAAALPCVAQTPDPSLPKPWHGAFASYGPSVLFLPKHAREGFVERGGVRIGYVRPISSSTGGMVALEVQRLALDHDDFYEKSIQTIGLDGSKRSVITDLQGGESAMQSVILGLEITGAPVVGSTFTYLQGGVAMTRLVDEPLRYFAYGQWHAHPGGTDVRPGGVLGGGVRLAFPGGVHGVLEGGYSLTLSGRQANSWLHLLSLRLGLAYRL